MDKSLEIYSYLLKNCIGYENRVKSDFLMKMFDINSNEKFRNYISTARTSYKYYIASEAGPQGGYWIANKKSDKTTTYKNLVLRAKNMIETAKKMNNKKIVRCK